MPSKFFSMLAELHLRCKSSVSLGLLNCCFNMQDDTFSINIEKLNRNGQKKEVIEMSCQMAVSAVLMGAPEHHLGFFLLVRNYKLCETFKPSI